mmetsp:Transcript_50526/g.105547  ORF Transcript_50526/g.105547 Transcript_50526/m.105547 type:complete len:126 (-) Transcript_50526:1148-1525(-)
MFVPILIHIYWQVLRLQDLLHFLIIHHIYPGIAAAIFHDTDGHASAWADRVMPWEASMALRAIDRGWRCGRFGTLGSPFRQALAAFTFQMSLFVDEMINVFWLGTRYHFGRILGPSKVLPSRTKH